MMREGIWWKIIHTRTATSPIFIAGTVAGGVDPGAAGD